MNLLLYTSFIYMVIHLCIWAFKKGEKVRADWETAVSPQLENTFYGNLKFNLFHLKTSVLSLFFEKYKLIKKELKKPYNELFSEQLINTLVKPRYIQEVRDEVNKIAFYKEKREYKKYKFNELTQKSKRLQFFNIKEQIYEAANKDFLRIIQKMYIENKLMKEEREIWKNTLIEKELLTETGDDSGVNLIIKHEIEQQNGYQVDEIPMEVVARTISSEGRKRF